MTSKTNTRITVDIPSTEHKKLKMIAAFQGKSMREILTELIERGLEEYKACSKSHAPNEITKKTIADVKQGKGLKKASSVEDLFKKLST